MYDRSLWSNFIVKICSSLEKSQKKYPLFLSCYNGVTSFIQNEPLFTFWYPILDLVLLNFGFEVSNRNQRHQKPKYWVSFKSCHFLNFNRPYSIRHFELLIFEFRFIISDLENPCTEKTAVGQCDTGIKFMVELLKLRCVPVYFTSWTVIFTVSAAKLTVYALNCTGTHRDFPTFPAVLYSLSSRLSL